MVLIIVHCLPDSYYPAVAVVILLLINESVPQTVPHTGTPELMVPQATVIVPGHLFRANSLTERKRFYVKHLIEIKAVL